MNVADLVSHDFAHGGPAGDDDVRPMRADFSTSVNAYGSADVVLEAIRAAVTPARVASYPDPTCTAPRRALAERAGVAVESIAVGAGAAELILAAVLAFVRAGDRVLVPRHAFGEYARAAALVGGVVVTPSVDEATGEESLADAVRAHRPRLAFLCTPESPGGRAWSRDAVRAVADACARAGAVLVLDQSFDAFAAAPLGTPALRDHPAVLHLRSLTKDHALAGVRVGCAVGTPAGVAAVERARMPWAVSAAAQAAAVAACTPEAIAHAGRTTAQLRTAAAALRAEFAPWCAVPSDVHYFLLRVGDAARATRWLRDRHALRVRDCTSFGLPAYVRVAARTPAENALLRDALRSDVLPRPPHPDSAATRG